MQGRALAHLEVGPHAPARLPDVHGLVGHPGRERLVEPQVVPPHHRDQVAEPLVRELVGDHLRDALLHVERCGGRIEQQRHLAKGDRPGVLHRAGLEVGHADLIQLPVGVRLPEVVLEERQHRGGAFLREPGEVALGRHRPGADRDAAHRRWLARGEIAYAHRDQVAGQRRRLAEGDRPPPVRPGLVLDHPAVRDGGGAGRDLQQLQAPARLERRLVEAREDAARVGGLELGHGDRPGAVQAAQARGELAAPGEVDDGGARRDLLVQREGDRLALRVGLDAAHADRPASCPQARPVDGQLDRVQDQLAPGLVEPHLQLDPSLERAGVEVGGEMRGIAHRMRVEGQAEVLAQRQGAPPEMARGCTASGEERGKPARRSTGRRLGRTRTSTWSATRR